MTRIAVRGVNLENYQHMSRVKFARFHSKFVTDGIVQNVGNGRTERSRSLTGDRNIETVLQAFTQSPRPSVRK
jgi:hypothetical protein